MFAKVLAHWSETAYLEHMSKHTTVIVDENDNFRAQIWDKDFMSPGAKCLASGTAQSKSGAIKAAKRALAVIHGVENVAGAVRRTK